MWVSRISRLLGPCTPKTFSKSLPLVWGRGDFNQGRAELRGPYLYKRIMNLIEIIPCLIFKGRGDEFECEPI